MPPNNQYFVEWSLLLFARVPSYCEFENVFIWMLNGNWWKVSVRLPNDIIALISLKVARNKLCVTNHQHLMFFLLLLQSISNICWWCTEIKWRIMMDQLPGSSWFQKKYSDNSWWEAEAGNGDVILVKVSNAGLFFITLPMFALFFLTRCATTRNWCLHRDSPMDEMNDKRLQVARVYS